MNELEHLAEIQREIAVCRRFAENQPRHSRLRWMCLLLADDLERWARMADQRCLNGRVEDSY